MTAKINDKTEIISKPKFKYFECVLARGTKDNFKSSLEEGISICLKSHLEKIEPELVEPKIKYFMKDLEYDFILEIVEINRNDAKEKFYIEDAVLIE